MSMLVNAPTRQRVECSVCGKMRRPSVCDATCRICREVVCDVCWRSEAGIGHAEAQHANEVNGVVEACSLRIEKDWKG